MLNLPPVHGYGVPQILSQWQAGQNRRQQQEQFKSGLELRTKEFELKQEQYKEQAENKKQLRVVEGSKNAFKFIDLGDKYIKNGNSELGVELNKKGYDMLNQIHPDLNIDLTKVADPSKIKEEADKQILSSITDLYKRAVSGDKDAISKMPGALASASYAGIDEKTLEFFSGYAPTGEMTDVQKEEAKKAAATTEFERKKELKDIPQKVSAQPTKIETYINNMNDPALDEDTRKIYSDMVEKERGKAEPKNKIELTRAALSGDMEAKALLETMAKADVELAKAKGTAAAEGKLAGLFEAIDVEGTADLILAGKETIENVKNTFGVPIQEVVRTKVLEREPGFNFAQPRAIVKSLTSSLSQQQKNRGMMGSFVTNINGQVDKLESMSEDVVNRVGVRALDVPIRELNTRFIGSGSERVFEGYMKEVSAEIAKLAQGSAASVAQLPESNRQEWERIHDVNLSMRELLIVLNGTREMANIRLESVQGEIDNTIESLGNVRKKKPKKKPGDIGTMTDAQILEQLNAK